MEGSGLSLPGPGIDGDDLDSEAATANRHGTRIHGPRIRDRELKLIKKVKKALDRIENGTFGICESCGEAIGEKRLKARPVTTQCIDCKEAEEATERALGI